MRKIAKYILRFLLLLLLLSIVLPWVFYIPAVQSYVCRTVVDFLNEDSKYIYSVGDIRLHFPLKLEVNRLSAVNLSGDTIFSCKRVQTGVSVVPIFRSDLNVRSLEVEDVYCKEDSLLESLGLQGRIGMLEVRRLNVHLADRKVHISQVVIDDTHLGIEVRPSTPDSAETESTPWIVDVDAFLLTTTGVDLSMPYMAFDLSNRTDSLSVAGFHLCTDSLVVQIGSIGWNCPRLAMNLDQSEERSPYFDYNHLDLNDMLLAASKVNYTPAIIEATIQQLQGTELNSALSLNQLSSEFTMEGSFIKLNNLSLQTDKAQLSGDVALDYQYFEDPHRGQIDVNMEGAIHREEVVRLAAPYLPGLERSWPDTTLQLQIMATADAAKFEVPTLNLNIPGYLTLSGMGKGILPFNNSLRKANFDLELDVPHGKFILDLIDTTLVKEYAMPDSLNLSVMGRQLAANYEAKAVIDQHGKTLLDAFVMYNSQTEDYQVDAFADGVKVKEFAPKQMLNGLSAQVKVTGRKFDLAHKAARMDASIVIDSINADTYGDIQKVNLSGMLENHNYELQVEGHDPHLNVQTALTGMYSKDSLTMLGNILLRKLDFMFIPGMDDMVGAMGFNANIDLKTDIKELVDLDLKIDSMYVEDAVVHEDLGDVVCKALFKKNYMSALVNGGDADFTMQSDCGINRLMAVVDTISAEVKHQVDSMMFHIDRVQKHIPFMDVRLTMGKDNPFSPVISYYLFAFDKISFQLSNDKQLNLTGSLYGYEDLNNRYDTIRVDLHQHGKAFLYDGTVDYSDPKPSKSYNLKAKGEILPDSLNVALAYINGREVLLHDFAASAVLNSDTVRIHIDRNPIIYAQQFEINPDNYIVARSFMNVEKKNLGIEADVRMKSSKGMSLTMLTQPLIDGTGGNKLDLNISSLNLRNTLESAKVPIDLSGLLNCEVTAIVCPDSIEANATLNIDHLDMGGIKNQDLTMDGAFTMSNSGWRTNGHLNLDSLEVLAFRAREGKDSTKQQALIHVQTHKLPLQAANAFLPSNLAINGLLSAELRARGASLSEYQSNGYFQIDQGSVYYADADATFKLAPDTMHLRKNTLRIQDYKITAANKNPISINGMLDFSEQLSNPLCVLSIKGNNVQAFKSEGLNRKQQVMYGTLPVDLNLNLSGPVSSLMLSGTIKALANTNIHYYLKNDPLSSDSKLNGMVDFVQFSLLSQKNTKILLDQEEDPEGGFQANLRMEIAKNSKVYLQLPTSESDHVSVRCGGSLQFSLLPDGAMRLNGLVDANSGDVAFKLPMLPVSKSFKIVDGSSVRFDGEVADPELNITASEEVRCTINEESGASRVVKFIVYVYIKNTLNNLAISFSCSAPEDGAIQSQLNTLTDDELSKQALKLLITQTYSGAGVSSSSSLSSANAAINALLQQEVESFLNQRLKGTEVQVGIDTYGSSGIARTDYSVKVSQRLFNDRIRVSVGGRMSSGADDGMGSRDDAIINDFSIEWLLRDDGTRYIRLFRKTNYESVLEGEIVETGLGYVMQRNAFRVRDLLMWNSEKRIKKILEQIRNMDWAKPGDPKVVKDTIAVPMDDAAVPGDTTSGAAIAPVLMESDESTEKKSEK